MSEIQDHYNVLGLKRTCSLDEVKQAYKKLVLRYHPDRRNGDEAKFHAIERAYKVSFIDIYLSAIFAERLELLGFRKYWRV